MVHFVGAGPGAPDLITLRGMKLLAAADMIIYAGSLVNPELLSYAGKEAKILDSAKMTLEEVIKVICEAHAAGLEVVRLHTGDPCLYGAVREQMDLLLEKNIPFDSCPGVSSFCGAASALNLEYTLPGISQTVILTRMEGRTPVPEKEDIRLLAGHQATMVIFLSAHRADKLSARLIEGGYHPDTPAAVVYKATWEEERKYLCTVGTLAETMRKNEITHTALLIIGDVVKTSSYERSKLYDPTFTTGYRKGKEKAE
ncbi:MAG: precorrin-4 C(11)-methyltransferase [Blautia sp.]|nr:precorrin-4 C(11)-methyltransferase [Blautia sp.]